MSWLRRSVARGNGDRRQHAHWGLLRLRVGRGVGPISGAMCSGPARCTCPRHPDAV